MSFRPLVFVSGLTLGDYLLWNWSLNHHHDVISEVAGLSLPVLGAACVWLFVLTTMRFVAHHTSAPARRVRRRARGSQTGSTGARPQPGQGRAHGSASASSTDKLAA